MRLFVGLAVFICSAFFGLVLLFLSAFMWTGIGVASEPQESLLATCAGVVLLGIASGTLLFLLKTEKAQEDKVG